MTTTGNSKKCFIFYEQIMCQQTEQLAEVLAIVSFWCSPRKLQSLEIKVCAALKYSVDHELRLPRRTWILATACGRELILNSPRWEDLIQRDRSLMKVFSKAKPQTFSHEKSDVWQSPVPFPTWHLLTEQCGLLLFLPPFKGGVAKFNKQ